jgi:NADH:ubiquinone oxidoreductase subunit 5 (subunit L)/multisubunit Na+/H+ antiporter MnhA subunit
MFGSALTLASFIKVLYCPFFSEKPKALPGKTKEAPFLLLLPQIFLALSCVVLGIFANFIIAKFIYLLSPGYSAKIMPSGVWQADLASALIFIGIICGVLFYWLMRKPVRKSETFIGGEDLPDKRIEGTDFYLTIKETPLLKTIYAQAEENGLSIYPLGAAIIKAMANFCYYCIDRFLNLITNAVGKLIFVFSWILKKIHNGLLDRYVAWVLLGAIIIMGVLFKCWNCM